MAPVTPDLIARAQAGDRDAITQLVASVTPFVEARARQFVRRGSRAAYDDLVNEALLRVTERAIPKFEPERGLKFLTYATNWINEAMTRLHGDAKTLLAARTVLQKWGISRLKKFADTGVMPADAPLGSVHMTQQMAQQVVYGGTVELDEIWNARCTSPDVEETIDRDRHRQRIRDAVSALSPREALIIQRRYLNPRTDGETLVEIGTYLGVSRERVRQLEAIAFGKLRARLRDEKARIG